MKKVVQIVLLLLLVSSAGFAQEQKECRPIERIHAAKIAYLTDRIQLATNQSATFLPMYNEYEKEVRKTRQPFLQKYRGMNMNAADDATARQAVDDDLDYQQQVLEIKKKYKDKFLTVLTPQQLSELYIAEREFRQMLLQRLRQNKARP